jgi:hypothetical protein
MALAGTYISTCIWVVVAAAFVANLLIDRRRRQATQSVSSHPRWPRNADHPPDGPARTPDDLA